MRLIFSSFFVLRMYVCNKNYRSMCRKYEEIHCIFVMNKNQQLNMDAVCNCYCSWSIKINSVCGSGVYVFAYISLLFVRICRFRRAAATCVPNMNETKKNGETQWLDARCRCERSNEEKNRYFDYIIFSIYYIERCFKWRFSAWVNERNGVREKKICKIFSLSWRVSDGKKSLFIFRWWSFVFCLDRSEWNFYWRLILSVMATATKTLTLSCLVYTRHTRIASSHYSHWFFFHLVCKNNYGGVKRKATQPTKKK